VPRPRGSDSGVARSRGVWSYARPPRARRHRRRHSLDRLPYHDDAFQPINAGGVDLAIVQLDRRGRLRFSSYLGGSGDDDNAAGAPALDARGNFYVSGVTSSTDFPVTPDAIQATYGGGDIDGLLAKIALSQ
jgi:hypothetical protein